MPFFSWGEYNITGGPLRMCRLLRTQSILLLIVVCILIVPVSKALAVDIVGRVLNAATGEPLQAATVRLLPAGHVVLSDASGTFTLLSLEAGPYELSVTYVGFAPLKTFLTSTTGAVIRLTPVVLPGEEVIVTTTRVSMKMPITHSNMTEREIDRDLAALDVPMLLARQPGVYAYSDAGNGTGYTYMQIRGFEQRKVGVYLNGVPLNDPLSHSVYWVDLADIMESASDVQIQRGVGNSLYGASAPGGVVSVELDPFGVKPRFRFTAGSGSYKTQKFSLEGSSGLIDNTYAVYGRFSRQVSDGYRYNAWSDTWSYFVGVARYDRNIRNRFYVFGGPEQLHAAWDGIDETQLATDRRFNPYTYEHETDTFNQAHYQWLTDWVMHNRVTLHNTSFYVKGDGYFIQDKSGWSQLSWAELDLDTTGMGVTAGDAVVQRHLQNDFYGMAPRLEIAQDHGRFTVGGEWSRHTGYHFGEVLSVVPAPVDFKAGHDYYNYDVNKTTATLYAQQLYSPAGRVHLMMALQYQWKRYEQRNDRRNGVEYNVAYSFLTPRMGVVVDLAPELSGYANFSLAQHEPVASEVYDPQDFEDPRLFFADSSGGKYSNPFMRPERMNNVELGLRWKTRQLRLAVNGFVQSLTDEIVPGGGIDQDGNAIRANAGKSVHRGIEFEGAFSPASNVEITANFTATDNYFKEYIEKFDPVNPVDYSGNTISSFPGIIGNAEITLSQPVGNGRSTVILGGASIRHVGKIYLDNSQSENLTNRTYTIVNLRGGLAFILGAQKFQLEMMVYNATDQLYSTFGYTWGGVAYVWPAAERNYFVRLRTGW
jgi:iron complex outermembrane receptor protein